MKAFVEQIKALFAEKPDMVTLAMAELGYVLKPVEGAGQAEAAAEIERIKAEARTGTEKEVVARVTDILEVCALAGMEKLAIGFIKAGTSLEESRTKVLAEKAAEAGRTHIRSTVGALSTGEVNPLLADAKERADAQKKK